MIKQRKTDAQYENECIILFGQFFFYKDIKTSILFLLYCLLCALILLNGRFKVVHFLPLFVPPYIQKLILRIRKVDQVLLFIMIYRTKHCGTNGLS